MADTVRTAESLSFAEAPARGFELWDVSDAQGFHLGQLAYMPERKNRDRSPYEGDEHWWASVSWAYVTDSPGVAHSRSGFHRTREDALECLLGFHNGTDPA